MQMWALEAVRAFPSLLGFLNGFKVHVGTMSVHAAAFFPPGQAPPPFALPPADVNLQQRIEKLVVYAAKNGPSFVQTMYERQGGNPDFAFLHGGQGAPFYAWALYCGLHGLPMDRPLPGQVPQQAADAAGAAPPPQPAAAAAASAAPPLQPQQPPSQPGGDAALQSLPVEVSSGWQQVLALLTGSRDSIRNSQQWFMACAPYAAGMAEMMLQHVLASGDYKKQLHVIYLSNDILFKGLSNRPEGSTADADGIAQAFKPRLGRMMRHAFISGGQTQEVQQNLVRVMNFWGERGVYNHLTVEQLTMELMGVALPAGASGAAAAAAPAGSADVGAGAPPGAGAAAAPGGEAGRQQAGAAAAAAGQEAAAPPAVAAGSEPRASQQEQPPLQQQQWGQPPQYPPGQQQYPASSYPAGGYFPPGVPLGAYPPPPSSSHHHQQQQQAQPGAPHHAHHPLGAGSSGGGGGAVPSYEAQSGPVPPPGAAYPGFAPPPSGGALPPGVAAHSSLGGPPPPYASQPGMPPLHGYGPPPGGQAPPPLSHGYATSDSVPPPGQYPGHPGHSPAVPPAGYYPPPGGAPPPGAYPPPSGAGPDVGYYPPPPIPPAPEPEPAQAPEPEQPGFDPMSFPPGLIPKLVEEKLKTDPPYSPLSPLDIERTGVPPPPKMDAYLKSRVDKLYAQLTDYRPGMLYSDIEVDAPRHKHFADRGPALPPPDPMLPRAGLGLAVGPPPAFAEPIDDGSFLGGGGLGYGTGRGLGYGAPQRSGPPGRDHRPGPPDMVPALGDPGVVIGGGMAGLGAGGPRGAPPGAPSAGLAALGGASGGLGGSTSGGEETGEPGVGGPGGAGTDGPPSFEDVFSSYRFLRSKGYHQMIVQNAAKKFGRGG